MKSAVWLFLAITLGGCLPDQAKDLAVCRIEADRFYQGYRAVEVDDPRSQYIIACMAAKGYDFTISPTACSSQRPLPTQSTCYAPSNWLAWIIDLIRGQKKSH